MCVCVCVCVYVYIYNKPYLEEYGQTGQVCPICEVFIPFVRFLSHLSRLWGLCPIYPIDGSVRLNWCYRMRSFAWVHLCGSGGERVKGGGSEKGMVSLPVSLLPSLSPFPSHPVAYAWYDWQHRGTTAIAKCRKKSVVCRDLRFRCVCSKVCSRSYFKRTLNVVSVIVVLVCARARALGLASLLFQLPPSPPSSLLPPPTTFTRARARALSNSVSALS